AGGAAPSHGKRVNKILRIRRRRSAASEARHHRIVAGDGTQPAYLSAAPRNGPVPAEKPVFETVSDDSAAHDSAGAQGQGRLVGLARTPLIASRNCASENRVTDACKSPGTILASTFSNRAIATSSCCSSGSR